MKIVPKIAGKGILFGLNFFNLDRSSPENPLGKNESRAAENDRGRGQRPLAFLVELSQPAEVVFSEREAMLASSPTAQDFGINFDVTGRGIRATAVAPDSPAQELGLEPGDIILSLYDHPVLSAETWHWLTSYKSDYGEMRIKDVRTGSMVTRHTN